jgi:hypothetical protein
VVEEAPVATVVQAGHTHTIRAAYDEKPTARQPDEAKTKLDNILNTISLQNIKKHFKKTNKKRKTKWNKQNNSPSIIPPW